MKQLGTRATATAQLPQHRLRYHPACWALWALDSPLSLPQRDSSGRKPLSLCVDMSVHVHDDGEDEDMWISAPFSSKNSLHSALHDFESSLRCPICHGLFVIPVNLLPCQHTFCSECIRRFLKASSKGMNGTKQSPICPFCRNDLCVSGNESRYLVPNRPAEEMVQQYKVIRPNLKHTLGQHLATNESHNASQVTSLVWDLIRSRSTRSLAALQSALPRCLDNDNSIRQAGDRKRRRATQTAATHVEPVLDDEVQVVLRPKRKKKPATYYNQLSLQKLREKCKQEGLSTLGNEKTLKARHQEYITLYNSECDSLTPRSPSELVREIAMRESARAREGARNCLSGGTVAHKESRTSQDSEATANGAVATSEDPAFDPQHNNFAKLIAQAKKRMNRSLSQEESKEKWKEGSALSTRSSENKTPSSGPATIPNLPIAQPSLAPESAAHGMPSTTAPTAEALPTVEALVETGTTGEAVKRSVTLDTSKEKWSDSPSTVRTETPSGHATIPSMQVAQKIPAYNSAGMPLATTPTAKVLPVDQALIGIGSTNSAVVKVSPAVEVKPGWPPSKKSSSITSFLKPKANVYPLVGLHERGRPSKRNPSPAAMHQRGRPSICGPWNCHVCTFFNEKNTWSRAVCEMCLAKRKHPNEETAVTPAAKPADEHCTVFLDV